MPHTPAPGDYRYFDNVARDLELHALRKKVAELESGEALRKEREKSAKWKALYEREKAGRKKDQEKFARQLRKMNRMWMDVNEDLDAVNEAKQEVIDAQQAKLEEKDALLEELRRENADFHAANEALVHQMGKNHTNSNTPSSKDPLNAPLPGRKTKKRNNSRVKSGRKPGAQPGHAHHGRRKLRPTAPAVWHTEQPAQTVGEDGWYMTDEYAERLEVDVRVVVDVIPHRAAVWKNSITGEKKTSAFPEGLHDETNYSKRTEAIVLMLTHTANVAGRRVKQMLRELTDGVLDVSHGWIAGIPGKFSRRCQPEIRQIFRDLFDSPVTHTDSTVTMNNGKREAITVACSPHSRAAFFRHTRKKGHAAANVMPCAKGLHYKGVVVSDMEAAFIRLGEGGHQLCLAHLIRKLKDIIEMEKDSRWAKDMLKLLYEMIEASHEWLGDAAEADGPTPEQAADWRERFDAITEAGKRHYCEHPPTKYYLDGHNTCALFAEHRDKILLFLENPLVPPTNNMAERCLRMHKRALHQAVTYRSAQSIDDRCDVETLVQTARLRNMAILPILTDILSRPIPCNETEPSGIL